MKKLIAQMGHLRQKVAGLGVEYGLPNIRSLIIRKRLDDAYVHLQVYPHPTIITEGSNQSVPLEDFNQVEVNEQRFTVKGISRRVDPSTNWGYKYEDLVGDRIDYIIDGNLRLGKVVGGIICQFESINERTITWDLKLIYNLGEQSIKSTEKTDFTDINSYY